MKSHWIIVFKAPNAGTLSKKLEHFLGTKLLDGKLRNDYSIAKETYSCLDCFIEHKSKNWEGVVVEIFELIRKISVQWEISILDTTQNYAGKLDYQLREELGGYQVTGPSGIRLIEWQLLKNQEYNRLW